MHSLVSCDWIFDLIWSNFVTTPVNTSWGWDRGVADVGVETKSMRLRTQGDRAAEKGVWATNQAPINKGWAFSSPHYSNTFRVLEPRSPKDQKPPTEIAGFAEGEREACPRLPPEGFTGKFSQALAFAGHRKYIYVPPMISSFEWYKASSERRKRSNTWSWTASMAQFCLLEEVAITTMTTGRDIKFSGGMKRLVCLRADFLFFFLVRVAFC